MIRFNDTYIIGIDHGYGNLKTANTVTASGVKVHDIEPPFKKELLEFDGKFICIGENHKSFTADKTTDMDNYYLTLYGIGKELSLAGITEANVHLAVGLPLMWYSEQRDRFSEYMLQNEDVEFIYNNKRYSVHMTGFVNRNSFVFRLRIITTVLNRRRTVHTRQSLSLQRREMRSLHIWICVRNSAGEPRNSVGEKHIREK